MAGFLARRLPRLHSGYTRFRDSRFGQGAQWTWAHRRSVAFGLGVTYAGGMYLLYRYELSEAVAVRPNTWLVWKFYPGSIVDVKGSPSLAYLVSAPTTGEDPPHVMTIFEAVIALKRAAADPNVVGILGDFSTLNWPSSIQGDGLGLAQTEELMQAIHEFKMAKAEQRQQLLEEYGEQDTRQEDAAPTDAVADPSSSPPPPPPSLPSTIAFTDDFASQSTYLLASVFDKVYLQPSGGVPLVGVSSTLPFFARLLSKLGVKMHTEARTDYKSMVSMYTQDEALPKLQAENQAELLGELNRSVAFGIGVNRFPDLPEDEATDKATQIMAAGPYSGKEALELGLVDGLVYKSDIMRMLRGDALAPRTEKERREALRRNDTAKFRGLAEYAYWMQKAIDDSVHQDSIVDVAVCHLRGTISSASGDWSASSVVKGLREAAEDENIRVILLRVDSGGGSVTSSDSVYAAIKHVRETYGKPVIVSFGNVAASGGYYIATAADAIYASETTITGSIGVAGARPTVTRKLLDRAGIGLQTYITGAAGGSLFHAESPAERARGAKHIDETYEDFLLKVCAGRGIAREVVEEVAGGRVFTGLTAWARTDPASWEEKQAALRQQNNPLAEAMRALAQKAEEVLQIPELSSALRALDEERGAHNPIKVALAGATSKPESSTASVGTTAEWDLEDVTEPEQINTQRISMRRPPPPPFSPSSERTGEQAPDLQTSLTDAFSAHQTRIFEALTSAVKAADEKVQELSKAVRGEGGTQQGREKDATKSLEAEMARLAEHLKVNEALGKVLEAVGLPAAGEAQPQAKAEADSASPASPASSPSSSGDPASAAHLAALSSSSSSSSSSSASAAEADAAEARALASAASTSPFGKGLIDSIGGLYDAAMLAATWTLHAEVEEMRSQQPGLSYGEAQARIRPRCARVSVAEEGDAGTGPAGVEERDGTGEGGKGRERSGPAQALEQAWELNVRLVQYPRHRTFRERLREMGGSGGSGGSPGFSLSPSSSMLDPSAWIATLRAELSAALASAILAALGTLASDPVATLAAVGKQAAAAAQEGNGTRRGEARVEDEVLAAGGGARF